MSDFLSLDHVNYSQGYSTGEKKKTIIMAKKYSILERGNSWGACWMMFGACITYTVSVILGSYEQESDRVGEWNFKLLLLLMYLFLFNHVHKDKCGT